MSKLMIKIHFICMQFTIYLLIENLIAPIIQNTRISPQLIAVYTNINKSLRQAINFGTGQWLPINSFKFQYFWEMELSESWLHFYL